MTSGVRAVALVALLFLGQAQGTHAALGTFWRLALLSFDSPATQHSDELASQSAPGADVGREALTTVTLAAAAVQRAVAIVLPLLRDDPVRSSGISRAPPAV